MLPVVTRRRDPAPSRIRYRLQRMWLRPSYRWLVRRGVPWAVVGALAWSVGSDPAVVAAVSSRYAALSEAIATRPEFALTRIEVTGADPALAEAVEAATGLTLPLSSLGLDLKAVQKRLEEVDAVARADVRAAGGGALRIDIVPRVPAILHRLDGTLTVLDDSGARVKAAASREDFPDLPLIAGEGAEAHVPEALQLLRIASAIAPRIRGLVRVGNRRWDLMLDRDQVVMLPEENAAAALARVMALDTAEDILARDVTAVDLRDGRRPILRLSPSALDKLRQPQPVIVGEKT